MKFEFESLSELPDVAKSYLANNHHTSLHCFYAEMGTGKTTFINELCKQLGVEGETSSPTYSIINEYVTKNGKTIFHIDLYRISSIEEAIEIGIEDYINSNSYCFIEWPQIIEALLPLPYVKNELSLLDNSRRILNSVLIDSGN